MYTKGACDGVVFLTHLWVVLPSTLSLLWSSNNRIHNIITVFSAWIFFHPVFPHRPNHSCVFTHVHSQMTHFFFYFLLSKKAFLVNCEKSVKYTTDLTAILNMTPPPHTARVYLTLRWGFDVMCWKGKMLSTTSSTVSLRCFFNNIWSEWFMKWNHSHLVLVEKQDLFW